MENSDEISVEVFCALTNSNVKFISACRSLANRATEIGILTDQEVLQAICYNFLIKNFALISSKAFQKIENLLTQMIEIEFMSVKDIRTFVFSKTTTELLNKVKPISHMLVASFCKRFWKMTADLIARKYIRLFLELSQQFKVDEAMDISERVFEDIDTFQELFEGQLNEKDLEEAQNFMNLFIKLLVDCSEQYGHHLVTMCIKLKTDFNDKYVQNLLRLRPDFEPEQIKGFLKEIKDQSEKIKESANKKDEINFFSVAKVELIVKKFAAKLLEKTRTAKTRGRTTGFQQTSLSKLNTQNNNIVTSLSDV